VIQRFTTPDGRVVEAVSVQVVGADTQTFRFPLDDSSVLEMRVFITSILRSKTDRTPLGFPLYNTDLSVTSRIVNIPDSLIVPPQAEAPKKKGRDYSPEVG